MTAAVIVALVLHSTVRLKRWTAERPAASAVADLCALLELAVDSGMGLHEALRWSAAFADHTLRPGIYLVLRTAPHLGLARALRDARGPAASLLRALARPFDTGAAVGPVLAGLRERLEAEHLAAVETRLQRLPVKLLLPLALLMLPGLLLMIVAPALFDALSRFG